MCPVKRAASISYPASSIYFFIFLQMTINRQCALLTTITSFVSFPFFPPWLALEDFQPPEHPRASTWPSFFTTLTGFLFGVSKPAFQVDGNNPNTSTQVCDNVCVNWALAGKHWSRSNQPMYLCCERVRCCLTRRRRQIATIVHVMVHLT